jgi:hypothetical protein
LDIQTLFGLLCREKRYFKVHQLSHKSQLTEKDITQLILEYDSNVHSSEDIKSDTATVTVTPAVTVTVTLAVIVTVTLSVMVSDSDSDTD